MPAKCIFWWLELISGLCEVNALMWMQYIMLLLDNFSTSIVNHKFIDGVFFTICYVLWGPRKGGRLNGDHWRCIGESNKLKLPSWHIDHTSKSVSSFGENIGGINIRWNQQQHFEPCCRAVSFSRQATSRSQMTKMGSTKMQKWEESNLSMPSASSHCAYPYFGF